jgi:2-dehydropantoate 2-reductase
VRSVDPTGGLRGLFDAGRLIGCVVYSRATMRDSGDAVVSGQQKLQLGGVGGRSPVQIIADQLASAGISVTVESDIRRAVWLKLARNAATNLVSALTGTTLEQIGQDPALTDLMKAIALEVFTLAGRLGRGIDMDLDVLNRRSQARRPVRDVHVAGYSRRSQA